MLKKRWVLAITGTISVILYGIAFWLFIHSWFWGICVLVAIGIGFVIYTAIKSTESKLVLRCQVLSVHEDNSFDCRIMVVNEGHNLAKSLKVHIFFLNLEIITFPIEDYKKYGDYQRIDDLNHGIPGIQYTAHHNDALQPKITIRILELVLKIKVAAAPCFIRSVVFADITDKVDGIYMLNVKELEAMKAYKNRKAGVFMKKVGSSHIPQRLLKAVQQDSGKGVSQT